ncbi:hypothetical protein FN846DRAFT_890910 [Sphaerosporella brunnea]|uniref:Uncharacterized protein n=1 Tax=Sphaerosporella brunnea TaxID=1250544 RepID=A0A5J5EV77_9PEZI|nr:hypothetical protein FN846DRAFT_890910 [Sphaerosporella brunnea]
MSIGRGRLSTLRHVFHASTPTQNAISHLSNLRTYVFVFAQINAHRRLPGRRCSAEGRISSAQTTGERNPPKRVASDGHILQVHDGRLRATKDNVANAGVRPSDRLKAAAASRHAHRNEARVYDHYPGLYALDDGYTALYEFLSGLLKASLQSKARWLKPWHAADSPAPLHETVAVICPKRCEGVRADKTRMKIFPTLPISRTTTGSTHRHRQISASPHFSPIYAFEPVSSSSHR